MKSRMVHTGKNQWRDAEAEDKQGEADGAMVSATRKRTKVEGQQVTGVPTRMHVTKEMKAHNDKVMADLDKLQKAATAALQKATESKGKGKPSALPKDAMVALLKKNKIYYSGVGNQSAKAIVKAVDHYAWSSIQALHRHNNERSELGRSS
jgi:hypothetical protein